MRHKFIDTGTIHIVGQPVLEQAVGEGRQDGGAGPDPGQRQRRRQAGLDEAEPARRDRTLYHALTPYGAKKVFSIFDHSSIYILIAGTYTPYCLTALQGATGWTLFGIIWALAVLGVVFYAVFGNRLRFLSVIMYILMGWLIIFAINPMKTALSQDSLVFLVSGGAAYTVGVIFYALKKVRYAHCIWHLFVLAGSILHFFSLFLLLKS